MNKPVSVLVMVAYALVISGTADQFDGKEPEPVLRELPDEILYRTGHQLQLPCSTVEDSAQRIEYTWNKNGKSLDLKSAYATQNENDGTITFKEATEDTEGTYKCFAKTSFGTASTREVQVKRAFIDYPKVIRQTHKPELGKPYKLDCNIPNGYPKPIIEWVRNKSSGDPELILDLRITTGPDGALYFTNITHEDVGDDKYVCRAISQAVEKPVVLAKHVIEEAVVNNEENDGELVPLYLSNDVVAKAGDETRFCCIYGGTPIAYPDWFFGEKNVNNEPNDRVTRYNRSGGKCLLIKETFLDDQGTYTCRVNNGIGKPQEHSLNLTVVSAPEFLNKPPSSIKVNEDQQVIIHCQVSGVETPKVTWTYNAKPLEITDKFKMVENNTVTIKLIKIVHTNDTGYYGCRAANDYGDVYAETLLNVIIPENNSEVVTDY